VPKNIVICCDGTGNSFDRPDTDSNVAKLYSCLAIDRDQRGYYHPGVGTMGAPRSRTLIEREWSKIKGLAFGAGLMANVADAYRYLMDAYEDGDNIFLFGFSRGAFTARVIASVLHVFGLLYRGNHELIPYILDMYSRRTREAQRRKQTFETDEAFKWQFSHPGPVRIKFCGVWDTVSSYGWIYDPVKLPFLGRNPIIDIGRHAVSIDERRCFYQDNLWGEPCAGEDIRQVWFSGVHSDVGGSYPEEESGLSKIALEWMFIQAETAGLRLKHDKVDKVMGLPGAIDIKGLPHYVRPNNNGCLHKSLQGTWWILEFFPHQNPHKGAGWYIPMGRRRTIPAGSWIHESVLTSRWKPAHLPPHRVEPWPGKANQAVESAPPPQSGKGCGDTGKKHSAERAMAKVFALTAAGAALWGVLRSRR